MLSKSTLSQHDKFRLDLRRHTLEHSPLPEAAIFQMNMDFKDDKKPACAHFSWITDDIEQEMKVGLQAPQPIRLWTRPGSTLIHNFLYYYSIARHLPYTHPQHQELIHFLRVSRLMSNAKLKSLHTLLWNVSSGPEKFPALEEIKLSDKPLREILQPFETALKRDFPKSWSFAGVKGQSCYHTKPPQIQV